MFVLKTALLLAVAAVPSAAAFNYNERCRKACTFDECGPSANDRCEYFCVLESGNNEESQENNDAKTNECKTKFCGDDVCGKCHDGGYCQGLKDGVLGLARDTMAYCNQMCDENFCFGLYEINCAGDCFETCAENDGYAPAPNPSCVDDASWVFITDTGKNKRCNWVSGNTDVRCTKEGEDGRSADEACFVTCDNCP